MRLLRSSAKPGWSYIVSLSLSFSTFSTLIAAGPERLEIETTRLKALSPEDLLNVKVTSVSRRPESIGTAAAAVSVLTDEDIRRSGAMNIPDALRLIPGVQVAQIDSYSWAVSSRGFNALFSNKQLVLIDGRSVYSPVQSGVYWDTQNIFLEDIDRIEVIRGPGSTQWGANAVNGVINIITKKSSETQGGLVSLGAGSEERGFAGVRFGTQLREQMHLRLYGNYFNKDASILSSGGEARDQSWHGQGGFRLDWEPSTDNLLTFQGDLFHGRQNARAGFPTLTAPYVESHSFRRILAGGNLLARWTHLFGEGNELQIQGYYDQVHRDQFVDLEKVRIYDLDLQHRLELGDHHQFMWGAGYRLIHDDFNNSFYLAALPKSRNIQLFSAFVQDEISMGEKLKLTLGTKVEHTDYTGFEWQPSARLGWQAAEKHYFWVAASRAVRTPSRLENDGSLNLLAAPGVPFPTLISATGHSGFDSEELEAYELGYRVQPLRKVTLDFALFYNIYENLRTTEMGTPVFDPTGGPHIVVPFTFANKAQGETYGGEVTARWQALERWRLEASYSMIHLHLNRDPGSNDATTEGVAEGNTPQQQFVLRSLLDLPRGVELDAVVRYVDSVPNLNIPHYLVADVHLGWHPNDRWELGLFFRNLFDDHHPEFVSPLFTPENKEVQHSFFAKVRYRF